MRNIFKAFGAIGGVAVTAASIAVEVAGQLAGEPVADWPWMLTALIAFVIFVVTMTWIYVEQRNEVSRLQGQRPAPVVKPRHEYKALWLDVTNEGESARFSCEIRFARIGTAAHSGIQPSATERFRPSWASGVGFWPGSGDEFGVSDGVGTEKFAERVSVAKRDSAPVGITRRGRFS